MRDRLIYEVRTDSGHYQPTERNPRIGTQITLRNQVQQLSQKLKERVRSNGDILGHPRVNDEIASLGKVLERHEAIISEAQQSLKDMISFARFYGMDVNADLATAGIQRARDLRNLLPIEEVFDPPSTQGHRVNAPGP